MQKHLAPSSRVTYSSTAVLTEYNIIGTRLDLTWDEIHVDRRVLVYTMSRRNVVLDYSSCENASVQVDDSV